MFSSNFLPPEPDPEGIGTPWLTSVTHVQTEAQPNWSIFMHTHNTSIELSYVLSGRGALYCNGKYFELTGGDLVIINPGVQHAEVSNPDDPLEQASFLTAGLKISSAPENTIPISGLPPVLPARVHQEIFEPLVRDILRTARQDPPDLSLLNQCYSFLIRLFLDEIRNASADRLQLEEHELMEEIRRWIDKNYLSDLSLDEIAAHFYLSVYHLARQFKKYTGHTINQYITSCRLGEAQRRLIFTDERIDHIAGECGYSNLSYFYATFRKKVGCTPAEYKNMYSRTI